MRQQTRYIIGTYGNEYYASYDYAKTYKDALLKYNKEIEMAKRIVNIPEADLYQVHIKIVSMKTNKVVKHTYVKRKYRY